MEFRLSPEQPGIAVRFVGFMRSYTSYMHSQDLREGMGGDDTARRRETTPAIPQRMKRYDDNDHGPQAPRP